MQTYTTQEMAAKLNVVPKKVARKVRRLAKAGELVDGGIAVRLDRGKYGIAYEDDKPPQDAAGATTDADGETVDAMAALRADKAATGNLINRGPYTYAPRPVDSYTFALHMGGRKTSILTYTGAEVRAWYAHYTTPGVRVEDMLMRFELDRQTFIQIKRLLSLTKASIGLTDEEVILGSEDELTRSLVAKKKREVKVRASNVERRSVDKIAEKSRRYIDLVREALDGAVIDFTPHSIRHTEPEPYQLVYCMADAHIGKRAYGRDDYTIHTQTDSYAALRRKAIDKVQAQWGTPERIVYANLGDYLHVDTNQGQTTSQSHNIGASMSCSAVDMVTHGARYLLGEIEDLRAWAPTDVAMVPGNHDRLLSHALKELVRHKYGDLVNMVSGDLRLVHSVYDTPIMMHHGNHLNPQKATAFLLAHLPELTRQRLALVVSGHYHEQAIKPVNYASSITAASPSPADDWHFERAYLSRPGLTMLRIERGSGHVGTMFVPMD